ncbi:HAD-superfamily hydrolase [Listeria weihenstephanensis FSL R9-0317]|uniref:Hydrolase n=1 Tax=Listeria weihenstephanensis TaxID=1006155 RepID=A0A1S7FXR4_9LIST|nr:HAD-IIB family hydrolase [Listeria weihenstephanensis]AQY52189.1 hydrolase [Listeria weihenstephanensis]EUJ39478.1 HAD-superfamily hydrolase [Listeria weihenstephanensis FSL R9-0317]
MIKLVITDMDGTFLNSKGDFNRELYREVKQLMLDKNVAFAPCTGKQCDRVEQIFGPEDSRDLWILGDSASRIKRNGEFVYESLIKNEMGLAIIAKLEAIRLDYVIIACTSAGAIVKDTIDEAIFNKMKNSYSELRKVADFNDIDLDFVKITVYDAKEDCFNTRDQLAEFFDKAHIVASEAAWIDITDVGVHKGTTVARLQEILGVTHDETMVFGDGLNDLELMEAGLYSFAMRNGFQETKDAANYIVRSNDEDGVLQTIKQILALQ